MKSKEEILLKHLIEESKKIPKSDRLTEDDLKEIVYSKEYKVLTRAMDEYASQFGYSKEQMKEVWNAAFKRLTFNPTDGFSTKPNPYPSRDEYINSLPEPSHLHSTDQVLKIAGEAWDTALSDQCDVNTYLTQLKSQLKK